jgi:hypothetical protein
MVWYSVVGLTPNFTTGTLYKSSSTRIISLVVFVGMVSNMVLTIYGPIFDDGTTD